ncbi:hypothetical protein FPQ18DRAFT_86512 [Pyronema domesticum]|uniref:Uncharacterized protein n=1 Tax=Pyronema omphalodes (strain CBS 100304) TaxID=1076935 RepID=U4LS56_PYROM|nr:hypothetical protein FPQ18DRAFT_86512 [Pyronema domesticum]CCX34780.1 Similar to predicted protein [Verticillium albo-atrum VaMs.102]; acc. no. XP_003008205 [Pyronema omphalodes CBS 100304]
MGWFTPAPSALCSNCATKLDQTKRICPAESCQGKDPNNRPLPQPIDEKDIPTYHSADASVYPAPIKLSQLKEWIHAAPKDSIEYRDSEGKLAGYVIALPLRLDYWRNVVDGKLKEWEIKPSMFKTGSHHNPLHIWHIEKYPEVWKEDWGHFSEVVRSDLKLDRRPFSGLCVTREGRRTFKFLGAAEEDYKGQVMVNGKIVEKADWDGEGHIQGVGAMLVSGRHDPRLIYDEDLKQFGCDWKDMHHRNDILELAQEKVDKFLFVEENDHAWQRDPKACLSEGRPCP